MCPAPPCYGSRPARRSAAAEAEAEIRSASLRMPSRANSPVSILSAVTEAARKINEKAETDRKIGGRGPEARSAKRIYIKFCHINGWQFSI